MDLFIIACAFALGFLGIIGSVLPAIPGPPLSWLGLLVLYIWGSGTNAEGEPITDQVLMIWLLIVTVVTVLDYIIPAYFTKLTGGSKYGSWGALIGMIAGLFIPPIGMILGLLLGTFLAEMLFANKEAGPALKSTLGAFVGFLCGTGLKLLCSGVLMYYIFVYAF